VGVHTTISGPKARNDVAVTATPKPTARGRLASAGTGPAGSFQAWQASPRLAAPDDALEIEADRIAARIMQPDPTSALAQSGSPGPMHPGCHCGGTCSTCREAPARGATIQARQVTLDSHSPHTTPAIVGEAARLDGRPLEPALRQEMEARLGHDFSRVRIHTGGHADRATLSIGARAYTSGADIVFGRGEYDPMRIDGRRLLSHELVHVVQQGAAPYLAIRGERATRPEASGPAGVGGASGIAPWHATAAWPVHRAGSSSPTIQNRIASHAIQRATFKVGQLTINVDYGNVIGVADAALVSTVESQFIAFTGAANASAIHAALVALTPAQQRWVLFALDLHQDNIQSPRDDRLDRTDAVQRLIAHAPSAANTFPGALGPAEEEALRASGFFETALSGRLAVPGPAFRSGIDVVLNPPAVGGGAVPPLDVAAFHARMDPAVRHLLAFIDPGGWSATGTQSIATLQSVGDDLMREAKSFFSPFAHTARESVLGIPGFAISANIFDVTALAPDQDTRLSYLENRSTIVGRNTSSHARFSDTNIFRDVNFDGTRAADQLEMEKLVTALEGDATVAAQANRLIQHTGRQEGSGASTKIGLSTGFDAGTLTECEARWETVETLCHEIMHALAHPRVETEAATVGFGQVIVEGMAEVLATQLFNRRVKPKAKSTPAFKAKLEAGIAGAPCPEPPAATIGYAAAGSGADSIQKMVGDKRFRSAFFLGQMHLLGR
jgi:hypothetical protein